MIRPRGGAIELYSVPTFKSKWLVTKEYFHRLRFPHAREKEKDCLIDACLVAESNDGGRAIVPER